MELHDLRVAFIGMNHVYSLSVLRGISRRCRVVGVIRSTRRGAELGNDALGAVARRQGVPYYLLTHQGRDTTEFLKAVQPDVLCVASMGRLLRREEFSIPRLGAVNLHPSLLPRYRGPDPYFWQYHEMDLEGGRDGACDR